MHLLASADVTILTDGVTVTCNIRGELNNRFFVAPYDQKFVGAL
jgi:hypothetical protein